MNIPDRLSVEPFSVHYDLVTAQAIDVYFNGIRQMNCVAEYCISEGWIRRYKTTATGRFFFFEERGGWVVGLFRGKVQVVPKGMAPPAEET